MPYIYNIIAPHFAGIHQSNVWAILNSIALSKNFAQNTKPCKATSQSLIAPYAMSLRMFASMVVHVYLKEEKTTDANVPTTTPESIVKSLLFVHKMLVAQMPSVEFLTTGLTVIVNWDIQVCREEEFSWFFPWAICRGYTYMLFRWSLLSWWL